MNKNIEASIKNLEMEIGQLSQQMTSQASSSGGFINNNIDSPTNETCKTIELRNRSVPSNPKVSEEKKESRKVEMKSGK